MNFNNHDNNRKYNYNIEQSNFNNIRVTSVEYIDYDLILEHKKKQIIKFSILLVLFYPITIFFLIKNELLEKNIKKYLALIFIIPYLIFSSLSFQISYKVYNNIKIEIKHTKKKDCELINKYIKDNNLNIDLFKSKELTIDKNNNSKDKIYFIDRGEYSYRIIIHKDKSIIFYEINNQFKDSYII